MIDYPSDETLDRIVPTLRNELTPIKRYCHKRGVDHDTRRTI